jgi:negative modulator of initiation of replication
MTMLPVEQELKATLACVELLKGLPAAIRPRVARRLNEAFPEEVSEASANGKPSNIGQLVESDDFQSLNTAQDQYLAVLSHVFEVEPSKFAAVAATVKGRKRRYFAASEKEITDSGTSTKPAQICPGGWWADLNNSTDNKRANLKELMQGLGYSKADCDLACKAIR